MSFSDDSLLIYRDFYNLMLGDKLGSGMSRTVFAVPLLPGLVAKVETGASFQNQKEWDTWWGVRGTKHEKWFAPCERISPDGRVLLMAKTLQPHVWPKQMPVYLTDLKRPNFGIYKGRLVCHDYGTNSLNIHGLTSRVRTAHWCDG